MSELFEMIVRFGLLIGTGLLIIAFGVHRIQMHNAAFSDSRLVRTNATVRSIQAEDEPGHGNMGYIFRVEAEYAVSENQRMTSVSQNTVHSEKDYRPGETVEILYDRTRPSFFYVAEDRNFKASSIIIFSFGTLFTLLGIVLLVIHLLSRGNR